jgi:hypothetical protein
LMETRSVNLVTVPLADCEGSQARDRKGPQCGVRFNTDV